LLVFPKYLILGFNAQAIAFVTKLKRNTVKWHLYVMTEKIGEIGEQVSTFHEENAVGEFYVGAKRIKAKRRLMEFHKIPNSTFFISKNVYPGPISEIPININCC